MNITNKDIFVFLNSLNNFLEEGNAIEPGSLLATSLKVALPKIEKLQEIEMHDLFQEVTDWQKVTFPLADSKSKVEHLIEEVHELKSDLENEKDSARLEFADCFILLFGAASAHGLSFADVYALIKEKHEINKLRSWGEPDEKGVVKHIEEDENTANARLAISLIKDAEDEDGVRNAMSIEEEVSWLNLPELLDEWNDYFGIAKRYLP